MLRVHKVYGRREKRCILIRYARKLSQYSSMQFSEMDALVVKLDSRKQHSFFSHVFLLWLRSRCEGNITCIELTSSFIILCCQKFWTTRLRSITQCTLRQLINLTHFAQRYDVVTIITTPDWLDFANWRLLCWNIRTKYKGRFVSLDKNQFDWTMIKCERSVHCERSEVSEPEPISGQHFAVGA